MNSSASGTSPALISSVQGATRAVTVAALKSRASALIVPDVSVAKRVSFRARRVSLAAARGAAIELTSRKRRAAAVSAARAAANRSSNVTGASALEMGPARSRVLMAHARRSVELANADPGACLKRSGVTAPVSARSEAQEIQVRDVALECFNASQAALGHVARTASPMEGSR